MRNITLCASVLAGAMLTAVGACRRNPQPDAAAAAGTDTVLVMSLERGACRGNCPEYRVRLYESGKVLFDGTKNVASSGPQVGTATANEVQSLARAAAEGGFAALDTAYVYGSKGCGQYYTDLPLLVVGARVGTRMKTIQYDPGCQGAPGILRTLAARVDTVAGTSVWIEGKGGTSK